MSDSAAARSPRSRAIRSLAPLRYVSYPSPARRSPSSSSSVARDSSPRQRCARLRGGGRADSARTVSRDSRRSRPTRDPSGKRAPASRRARPPARARGRRNGRGGAARGAARSRREARPGAATRRSGRRQQPRASPTRRPRTGDPDRRSRKAARAVGRSRPPPPGSAAGRRRLCVRAPSANERSSRLSSDSASLAASSRTSSGAPSSSMLARARSARAFASLPSAASSSAFDAHSSMSCMFRRIDHIADLIEDWKARNAYVSACSWSSSGPSRALSSAFRIPSPS